MRRLLGCCLVTALVLLGLLAALLLIGLPILLDYLEQLDPAQVVELSVGAAYPLGANDLQIVAADRQSVTVNYDGITYPISAEWFTLPDGYSLRLLAVTPTRSATHPRVRLHIIPPPGEPA